MRWIARRRLLGLGSVVIVGLAILGIHAIYTIALHRTSYCTGWSLVGIMFALTVMNGRKKLPFLPLGNASVWLQIHLYLGLLTLVVFAVHVGYRVPNGVLERTMFAVYMLVAGSGIVGLGLSRWLPPRLSRRGEEVLFERIPTICKRLRDDAEGLVLGSVTESGTTTIADFYQRRLHRFFEGPRHFFMHLVGASRPRRLFLAELGAMERYLNTQELETVHRLADLVRVKDDLDYQYAGQAVLKYWLFAHIPLTYCLWILVALHVVLAYSFSGGLR